MGVSKKRTCAHYLWKFSPCFGLPNYQDIINKRYEFFINLADMAST